MVLYGLLNDLIQTTECGLTECKRFFFYVYHEPKAQKHFLFLDAKVHVSKDNAMKFPN